MATFYANPDFESEQWIERPAIDQLGFRIWHLMFFCFCAFVTILILVCCCVKFRVPRTKQEIDADYHRKKLAEKFRKRLKLIKNQDMDALDLEQALTIIQEEYQHENKVIDCQNNEKCVQVIDEKNQKFTEKVSLAIVKATKTYVL